MTTWQQWKPITCFFNQILHRSLYLSVIVMTIMITIFSMTGYIIYARYFDCDPLLSGIVTSRDQVNGFSIVLKNSFDYIHYFQEVIKLPIINLSSGNNNFVSQLIPILNLYFSTCHCSQWKPWVLSEVFQEYTLQVFYVHLWGKNTY